MKVLDCTLRDGGYCNNWQFGKKNIDTVIKGLVEAKIDIIECGFVNSSIPFNQNSTKLPKIENFSSFLPEDKGNTLFVCMMNFGDCKLEDIPDRQENFIDGIRVAFHKKNMIPALEFCRGLKQKGYKIFIQAMVSLNYSDEEFLHLLKIVNEIEPYAFYIVDSFGVMKRRDLMRIFYIVEHNLLPSILIGYHSHNNLQLSYSNAQILVDIRTKHNLIVDSSIFGMGRGAGNLNTELFVEYLNDNLETDYQVTPLLNIIDDVLMNFYDKHSWGYSLPFYLSATLGCHPNYASFLEEKKTLPTKNFYELLKSISPEDRIYFNKNKANFYYSEYLTRPFDDKKTLEELRKIFHGKEILLLAPGNSLIDYLPKIQAETAKENRISISINFSDERFPVDYIFVSNIKKYELLPADIPDKVIATSNILDHKKSKYVINFSDYISEYRQVVDNAGLMALHFLKTVCQDGTKIFIAGMDGYISPRGNNFIPADSEQVLEIGLEERNIFISKELRELKKIMNLTFITPTHYNVDETFALSDVTHGGGGVIK